MNQVNSPAYNYQGSGQPLTPQQAANASGQLQPNNPATFQSDSDIVNDGLADPVTRCKELTSPLIQSLQLMLTQLSVVLNPANQTRITSENQFQLLGRFIENFNRVCDLFVVNLRTACEAQHISNELKLFSRWYAHIGQMDAVRAENPLIHSVNIQMQRINEFRAMMQKYLATPTAKQQQSQQPHHAQPPQQMEI